MVRIYSRQPTMRDGRWYDEDQWAIQDLNL
jgi:hypothetical protein